MDYRNLQIEIRHPVATMTLHRPPRNLLDIDMIEEIADALLRIRNDAAVEVLVVRGAGGNFCEGLDLREHVKNRLQRLIQVYSRVFETLRMMDVVSIAAIEGNALGGGFELALGCNLIVAAADARFALPEVRHGIFPPIACIILPRVTPRRRAMEWILTGNDITAVQLERDGLINRLFSPAEFDAGLAAFVDELARSSGPVLQLAKKAQYEAYYSTYEEALYKVQNLYLRDLMELQDAEEGLRAYREGREAVWHNR